MTVGFIVYILTWIVLLGLLKYLLFPAPWCQSHDAIHVVGQCVILWKTVKSLQTVSDTSGDSSERLHAEQLPAGPSSSSQGLLSD